MRDKFLKRNDEKLSGFYLLSLFFIYLLALTSFFPIVRSLSYFNIIWSVLILLWLMAAIISKPSFFVVVTFQRLTAYFFILYTILIPYGFGINYIGNRYFELTQIIVFYWSYQISKSYGRNFDSVKLLLLLMPVVVVTSIITLYTYVGSPNVSRTAKKDTELGLSQMAQGIGGYEFVYFIVFLAIPLLYLFLNKKIKLSSAWSLVVLLLLVLFLSNIIMSNFTTALLILFFAIIFRVFFYNLRPIHVALFVISVPFWIYFLPLILHPIINFGVARLEGTMNAYRLMEINDLLIHGTIELALGARIDAFSQSLYTFFQYPIYGYIVRATPESLLLSVGQHSFVFDAFAMFGFLIGMLQLYVFLSPLTVLLRRGRCHKFSLSFLMLILTVIFLLVNNATPSIGFAIFFFYPVVNQYLIELEWKQVSIRRFRVH